jgi:predicted metal-dependent phosphotriesterase family hydrolase
VPPARVVVGHLGERRDARDVLAVAATGVFVQIDHVGRPPSAGTRPESRRARTVADVARAGHLDQPLISMDICATTQLHWYGGHGYDYDYLLRSFVRLLVDAGLVRGCQKHCIGGCAVRRSGGRSIVDRGWRVRHHRPW